MKRIIFVLIMSILIFSLNIPVSFGYTNEYVMDFEDSIVVGISSGSRVEKITENGTYCYKIGSLKNNIASIIQLDEKKSGIVSISMEVYLENNTNAFCFTLKDENGIEAVKLRFVNQEIITAYTSEDGGATTSVIDLSVVSEPCTWSKYTFEVNTDAKTYKLYRNNVPIISHWIPFYRTADNIKNILVETTKGSFMYIDNINVHNFVPLNPTLSSTSYTVDNKNKMITDIIFGTEVSEFVKNISSDYAVSLCDKLGNLKSYGKVTPDDTLYVSDGESYCYYALGLKDDSYDYTRNFSQLNISKKLYVSPDGSDSNVGILASKPFNTLKKCEEYITKNAPSITGDVVIYMKGGIYEYTQLNSFNKSCKLSNGKIIIQPYNDEKVIVTGGKSIQSKDFVNISDSGVLERLDSNIRNKILEYNLSDIDKSLLGERVMSGWNLSFIPGRTELYKNTQLQTLARYPDKSTIKSASIVNPDKAYHLNGGSEYGSFTYSDTEIETWLEPQKAWIWSHFGVGYGGHDINISNVDTMTKTITVGNKYYQSPQENFNYYYDNVLEELNTPGEWYYDDTRNKIYYYPDEDFSKSVFYLSLLSENLLSFYNLDNIYIKDITFVASRGDILGFYDCNNVLLENCTVSGAGMNGIVISGGRNNNVVNCEVSDVGGDAIKIYGGNTYTLTPSGSGVYNCCLHDFSKRKKSYTGGVTASGVGITVKNNQIYDAPHLGIQLRGNDFLIENNHFSNLVYNAKDMGAVYTYNNYVWRGTSILNNRFENIRNVEPSNSPNLSKCVFLDNYSSGYEVKKNIFVNCDEGIHANGGRSNIVSENIFCDTDKTLIFNNFTAYCEPPYSNLKTAPVESRLWKNKYDGIDNTASLYAGTPYGTKIGNNLFLDYPLIEIEDREKITVTDNIYLNTTDYNEITNFKNNNGIDELKIGTNCISDKLSEKIYVIKDSKVFEGTYEMKTGETESFECLVTGKFGKTDFVPEIKSLNDEIASVDKNFNVSANKAGTVTIMLTYGNVTNKIKIRVTE